MTIKPPANSANSANLEMFEEADILLMDKHKAMRLIATMMDDLELPGKVMTAEAWAKIAMALAVELVKEKSRLRLQVHKTENTAFVMDHYIDKNKVKKNHDKRRVANRQDQIDMRAFQEAVVVNIDGYDTKAEAIQDLNEKPQFSKYSEKVLRGWLKPIWNKPVRTGRPKTK